MRPKMLIGIVGIYAACYQLADWADLVMPGSEWPVFVVLAGAMTGLLALAIKQGRFNKWLA
jgi:hypothetical protein